MAPLAFSFNGIKIFIFDDDHQPIHIHAKRDNLQTVFNLIIDNKKLIDIEIRDVGNSNTLLNEADTKKVKKFLKKEWKMVVQKWTDVVVFKTRITVKRISGL